MYHILCVISTRNWHKHILFFFHTLANHFDCHLQYCMLLCHATYIEIKMDGMVVNCVYARLKTDAWTRFRVPTSDFSTYQILLFSLACWRGLRLKRWSALNITPRGILCYVRIVEWFCNLACGSSKCVTVTSINNQDDIFIYETLI